MDNKITPTIGPHDIVDFMNGAGEMSTEGLRIDRSNSLPINEEMVKKKLHDDFNAGKRAALSGAPRKKAMGTGKI